MHCTYLLWLHTVPPGVRYANKRGEFGCLPKLGPLGGVVLSACSWWAQVNRLTHSFVSKSICSACILFLSFCHSFRRFLVDYRWASAGWRTA